MLCCSSQKRATMTNTITGSAALMMVCGQQNRKDAWENGRERADAAMGAQGTVDRLESGDGALLAGRLRTHVA